MPYSIMAYMVRFRRNRTICYNRIEYACMKSTLRSKMRKESNKSSLIRKKDTDSARLIIKMILILNNTLSNNLKKMEI